MNTVSIRAVAESAVREAIAADILTSLPDWFGIPESTQEYITESKGMPFFAAYEDERAIGFLAVKENNAYTAEIYVMGVKKEYHRVGIGRQLFDSAYGWCKEKGFEFLQVKTLDGSNPDSSYAKTRNYYQALGFRPLECLPVLWGESNPCLIMIMAVK